VLNRRSCYWRTGRRRRSSKIPEYLRKRSERATVAADVVEEIQHRYAQIGHSPLTEITLRRHGWLRQNSPRGTGVPVYVGMRNWRPYIPEVVRQMRADGIEEAAVICHGAAELAH